MLTLHSFGGEAERNRTHLNEIYLNVYGAIMKALRLVFAPSDQDQPVTSVFSSPVKTFGLSILSTKYDFILSVFGEPSKP